MNIGIYNPAFDSLSGGERYTLTIASHWSKYHTVSLFWDDKSLPKLAEDRLHIDLGRVKTTPNIFRENSVLKKVMASRFYDLIFFLSDGSVPVSLAKRNIIHFQIPFHSLNIPKWKVLLYQSIVCNSYFTKENIDPAVGKKSVVIYPPVDAIPSVHVKKEKLIVSVGRFSPFKKQTILVGAMKEAIKKGLLPDWRLVLAGGLLPEDRIYFEHVKDAGAGLPIEYIPNITHSDLVRLYNKATVYWHAAGFEEHDPARMEHFGISTVEAMSAGCIPVVVAAGGQPEIVKQKENGFLWSSIDEMLSYSQSISEHPTEARRMKEKAIETSKQFDTQRFTDSFDLLLKQLFS